MKRIGIMALAAVALTLLLSTTVLAYDGGNDASPGVHDPGTGMTGDPGTQAGTHDPGTGMTGEYDGSPGVHEPGTGMTGDPIGEPGTRDPQQHMFGDATGHWYEDYAENMAQHGFMQGYTNGDFGGEDRLTRAQFAAVISRMMGIGPQTGAPFPDTVGHWAEGHIAAMENLGIIHGHEDGTFGPHEPITRAQMAAMMDRALEHLGRGLSDTERQQMIDQARQHLDDTAGHWAEGHIAHMYERGITMGDDAGHYRPDEHTNRAQASAMLWRFFEGELQ